MTDALTRHCLPKLEKMSLDVGDLQRRRGRLVRGLRECGYEVRAPEGAFYVTPKAPVEDDGAFSEMLARRGVFCLPVSVVRMNGCLRASVTASDEMIERALPVFAAARKEVRATR
jgi:aspartate aminotransferase